MFDQQLLGPRIEAAWVEMLDPHDQRIDVLDGIDDGITARSGVTAGSVTYNVDSEIQGGASLTIKDPAIDWMNTRFRPWVMVNRMRWPLGIYVPSSPDEVHTRDGVSVTVTLLDKTSLASETKLTATYAPSASTPVTTLVQDILTKKLGLDATSVVITPSTKKMQAAQTWVPGTSWLTVINDLLGAITYNKLWADTLGHLRAEPWVNPATVTPVHVFAEGELSIHSPDFTLSKNMTSVPNRVTCVTAGDDTKPGMISVATNTSPTSPYSYAARGNRWVDAFYDGCEAADQKELDAQAKRNLANTSTPPESLSVQHALVPVKGRDVVRFTSGGIDKLAWINEWGVPNLTAGTLMTGKWMVVNA